MSFTSACYTPDELIQKTDYIIRGKITKLKEKTVTSVETTGNEKKYNIDIPYCIYEVEITENLKMPIVYIPAYPDGDSGGIRTVNRKHPDTLSCNLIVQ